jgi:hypothetical protein
VVKLGTIQRRHATSIQKLKDAACPCPYKLPHPFVPESIKSTIQYLSAASTPPSLAVHCTVNLIAEATRKSNLVPNHAHATGHSDLISIEGFTLDNSTPC